MRQEPSGPVRSKPQINAWITWREEGAVHTRWRLPPPVGRLRQALAKSRRNWPHERVGSFTAGEQNFRLGSGWLASTKRRNVRPTSLPRNGGSSYPENLGWRFVAWRSSSSGWISPLPATSHTRRSG